ncbi:hypothetical protein RQP46_011230 [Phenoliferia psychrophenolica]
MESEELFVSYEQDLITLISTINSKLHHDAREQRGDQRKAVFGRIERELEEADEIVAQMEIEVQTSSSEHTKATLRSRLKEHTSLMSSHRSSLLYEADGAIDRASNTVKKMVNRMHQQRAVTYGIIALLIFLIGYILVSKVF